MGNVTIQGFRQREEYIRHFCVGGVGGVVEGGDGEGGEGREEGEGGGISMLSPTQLRYLLYYKYSAIQ